MDIIQFISAAGFGGVIVALLQGWITNRSTIRQRSFEEKKAAYVGYLETL